MRYLLILFLLLLPPAPVWARSTAKNACLANLKQIDGAVQQWALEHRKYDTNRYSLTDPAVLEFFRGGVLPECPLGGTYVAGRSVADEPRCTIHGSWSNERRWGELEHEAHRQLAYSQMLLGFSAFGVSGVVLWLLRKRSRTIPGDTAYDSAPALMLVLGLLSTCLRFLLPENYRWPFFLWVPMLVFAFVGLCLSVMLIVRRDKKVGRYCFAAGILNFLLLLPIIVVACLKMMGLRF